MVPMRLWVGKQGSEALGNGAKPSIYQYTFTSLVPFCIFLDCFFILLLKALFSANF